MAGSVTDYVPHSESDVRAMLDAVGAESIDDLFEDIPEAVRRREPLELPAGLSEVEVIAEMRRLAAANTPATSLVSFLGAGDLRPLRAGRRRRRRLPLRVRHRLHALPAGAQPGRAADHLRVPDGDLRAHRHGRQQRRHVRRRHGAGRGLAARRAPDAARARRRLRRGAPGVPPGAGHRDGRTTGRARRSSTCRPARPPTSRPSGPPSTRTRRPSSSSSPTSSGPSRTWPPRPRSRTRPAPCSSSSPTRSRWAFSRLPGASAPTSSSARRRAFGNAMNFGGPGLGYMAVTAAAHAPHPRAPRRRDRRRRGQARLRAHAADPRAAHPPREGDQQHLLQPRPQRAGRARAPLVAGT